MRVTSQPNSFLDISRRYCFVDIKIDIFDAVEEIIVYITFKLRDKIEINKKRKFRKKNIHRPYDRRRKESIKNN